MLIFNVSYDIVTPESVEDGEADEYGFIGEGLSLRDAIDSVQSTRTNMVDGVESIECDSWPVRRARCVRITNGAEFETGATETRSLHIPDNVTDASSRRIARLLGARV